MPITITLDAPSIGFAESSGREGEIGVIPQGFCSSEDGDKFISRLEMVSDLLNRIPDNRRPNPSQVDHMLAVIHKDKTADLYINELSIIAQVQIKKKVEAYQPVYESDMADIRSLKFDGVEIPDDAGLVFLFSVGWRKGLFYDLGPFCPNLNYTRDYNLDNRLGELFAHLVFRDRLKISDDAWKNLFAQGWFPFAALSPSLLKEMMSYVENGWEIDDLLPKVTDEVKESLSKWIEQWAKNSSYNDHISLLRTAAERFFGADYHSAVSLVYPRIEGILRNAPLSHEPEKKVTQERLAETTVKVGLSAAGTPMMPFFPEKFQQYLKEVYFQDFDPNRPAGASRNTVGHGVAPEDAFSEKSSLIGFLILQHISYFLREEETLPSKQDFPVIQAGSWPEDLSLRREDMYDEWGR